VGRAEEIFEKIKDQGEAAIDEFILVRQSEELYLDFKRSADNGRGPRVLHENDRNNLAKAASGFGNSEGGVIVWGVDASLGSDFADVAKTKMPIENVARYVSWLEATISGRTVPAHPGVRNHTIDIVGGTGFVATLIPKSNLAPHQCVYDSRYYMRAGSAFLPISHSVLAGMFGRRPQPHLSHTFASWGAQIGGHPGPMEILSVNVTFHLHNKGLGIARDLYSDLRVTVPRYRCEATVSTANPDWTGRLQLGSWFTAFSKEGFKLAPESMTEVLQLNVVLRPPFENDPFWLKWTFGCDGAPTSVMEVRHTLSEVESLYQEFMAGQKTDELRQKFLRELLQLPEPQ
jgi:hypothetical protein